MKGLRIVFLIVLIISIQSMAFVHSNALSNHKPNSKKSYDYYRYNVVKEKEPKVTSCDYLPVYSPAYNAKDSVFKNSDLIIRCTIINKNEVALAEYKNRKVNRTVYRSILNVKVNRIFKADGTRSDLTVGKVLNIYNESCSRKWFVNSIDIMKGKEYILFLRQAKDENIIKFTKYASYIINAPTWSIVLKDNNKYYFDKNFSQFEYTKESSTTTSGYFRTTTYLSSRFEDGLLYYMAINKSIPDNFKAEPTHLQLIDSEHIKYMDIWTGNGKEMVINSKDKKDEITKLIKTINLDNGKLIDHNDLGITVFLEFTDGYKYSMEILRFNKTVLYHAAYNWNLDPVSVGLYFVDPNISEELKKRID